MRIALPLALIAAPALAVSALANDPETAAPEAAATEAEEKAQAEPQAKEEKRICRRVRLDMSSRRKERVCKTADEWRAFNQRR